MDSCFHMQKKVFFAVTCSLPFVKHLPPQALLTVEDIFPKNANNLFQDVSIAYE